MNEKATAAQARLAELATKFLDRTTGDLIAMRQDLGRMAQDDTAASVAALGDLRHLAHRMVGTGATLGFDSLSSCARSIELLAESCAPGVPPDEALRTQLADALETLGAELLKLRS